MLYLISSYSDCRLVFLSLFSRAMVQIILILREQRFPQTISMVLTLKKSFGDPHLLTQKTWLRATQPHSRHHSIRRGIIHQINGPAGFELTSRLQEATGTIQTSDMRDPLYLTPISICQLTSTYLGFGF